ncbi:MAG TPA: lysophospholipid acyltransferase family protein [Steroidobacteraceae bacterium]|nr:lysophospholipid acyltransferase family protein [Steroidobacteraceae bacterium]
MSSSEPARESSRRGAAHSAGAAPPLPFWLRVISSLPWRVLYGCGSCLAFLAHRVLRYRVAVVRANIARCFPQLEPRARRRIERGYYRSLGQLFAEVLKSATVTPEQLGRHLALREIEAVRTELDAGRPVLIVAAHQCNWEWLLLALSLQLGHPLDAAYKPLHSARADHLMRAMRTRFGSALVPAKEVLGRILMRRSAPAVAMVADQEPVTSDYKWWTTFLGTPTAFYMGPEKIAQARRCAVFFASMRRLERGRYVVRLELLMGAGAPLQPGQITERYARAVEAQVLASPADWTWSHRRWKLRRPVYGNPGALDQSAGEGRA